MKPRHITTDPLGILRLHAKLPADERLTEQILTQLCINQLKRNDVNTTQGKFIVRLLVQAQVAAVYTHNRNMYSMTCDAIVMWLKCMDRAVARDVNPSPTTGERSAVMSCLSMWRDALDIATTDIWARCEAQWAVHQSRFGLDCYVNEPAN